MLKPKAEEWQSELAVSDVVLSTYPPDFHEGVGHLGYTVVRPWRDTVGEEFGKHDANSEEWVILQELCGGPPDEHLLRRATVEAKLQPNEVEMLRAAEWPTRFNDFLDVIRRASRATQ